ncbi:hypothetical protein [Hydrogenophaga sp.]|uniref:hypothetical protein n=1 Tax=Hydrogenophaga sp. TaxID=1904254 RepID=UPI00261C90E2|nr:hypothetical protein [Hydrogenophaga sp.]MDM7950009.1 hypothetical protein [Hydrogenophaga sp.]
MSSTIEELLARIRSFKDVLEREYKQTRDEPARSDGGAISGVAAEPEGGALAVFATQPLAGGAHCILDLRRLAGICPSQCLHQPLSGGVFSHLRHPACASPCAPGF